MRNEDKRIQKGLETKESLIQAAVLLFSKNGYDGTSVKDIADRAGVPKSLFYHYFKTKHELLQFLIQSYDIQPQGKESALMEEKPLHQVLDSAGSNVFSQLSADKAMMKIIMQESLKDKDIMDMFLGKFDEVAVGLSSIMEGKLKDDVSKDEVKIFQLYFRFLPEILYLLTQKTVSEHYGISEEKIRAYFLKNLLQNPYLKNEERS